MRWRLYGAVLLGVALAACAPQERPAERTAESPSEQLPVEGGRVVRRLEGDPATLNFVLHSTLPEKLVLSYLHDALVEFNQKLEIIPGLAASWEISPDHKTYTFRLDPRANFSDGRPVTAADVVFTLQKIVDPKSQSVQLAGMFEGLDVQATRELDEKTVQVVFAEARPSQLLAFNIPILPKHVYAKGDFRRAHNDRVVGTGPYTLTRRVRGKEILLERRENYWRDQPWITSVLFRVIEDRSQAWNALKTGEIDETSATSDQWLADRENEAFREKVEIYRFYELAYNFIPWNNRDPVLADARVRRALTMCLDRRLIIEKLYYGTARMISGPFTPNHWAYNPAVPAIEFDPAAARNLLREAGWVDSDGDGIVEKGGTPLEIEMLVGAGDTSSANVLQIFQNDLQTAGVRLNVSRLDAATMFGRVLAGEFQGAMLAWSLDLDPDLFSLFHSSQFPPSGQNFVFYSNPEVDRLIEEGRTEFDQARRTEIYRELHRILAEDQPYTWSIQVSTKWGVNRRIRNVQQAEGFGLFGWYPGPMQWWIGADSRRFEAAREAR